MNTKLRAIIILVIILLTLLPVWMFIRYLEKRIQPRASLGRFFCYMLVVLFIVFAVSFLVVFGIRLLFPGA